MGAMASKNASSVSPVSFWMAAESASEVSGPVAMMTLSHLLRRHAGNLTAFDGDKGMIAQRLRDVRREMIAVHRQRASGRKLVGVASRHDQRAGAAHFLVQQPDRVGGGIVGAETVGADELRQPIGLVRLGAATGPHLVQHDRQSGVGDLPRRLAAGEAAADDVDGRVGHGVKVAQAMPA